MFRSTLSLFFCVIIGLVAFVSAAPHAHSHAAIARRARYHHTPTPDSYLNPHNDIRSSYGAAPLTWSASLADSAQAWANECQFVHSGSGENIAAGTDGFSAAEAVQVWADESSKYDAFNPVPSHFTQLVWKGTTELGCAVSTCSNIFDASYGSARYYVCHYNAAGNIVGEFSENVQA